MGDNPQQRPHRKIKEPGKKQRRDDAGRLFQRPGWKHLLG